MNHEAINPGIADTRVGVAHDAKAGGYIPAGIFLVVGENGQARYINIFATKNYFLDRRFIGHHRRLGTILARSILTDEFRQGSILEPNGPEKTPSIGVDIGNNRQRGAFDFFEDDHGKLALLLQLGENSCYFEIRIEDRKSVV